MKMSRRTFLKRSAGSLAAIALAAGTGVSINAFESAAVTTTQDEWKSAFCGLCHYPCCATKVRVVNGVAVEVKGDENGPNEGRLCVRGNSVLGTLYDPYRVKKPMKRTNPEKAIDNDPGWVEISWEEALITVAKNLQGAMNYNPKSVMFAFGFGVEESHRIMPFTTAIGGGNEFTGGGGLCPEHFNQLHLNGQMLDRADLEHMEYLVEIGRTMGSDWCATSADHSNHYADAVERGLKHVVVNPHCNHAAQRGEWVPIMPGTDTAFGLALLNVIIHEIGVYDEWSLKVHSNGPYLIDDKVLNIKGRESHKGNYVFNNDGKPLVWDEELNKAVPHDSSKGETYALLGEYEIDGKKYKTAFQILVDFVKDFTPEWQEQFTTISPAKVRDIAQNLVKHAHIGSTIDIDGYTFPYRPAGILCGRGMAAHMLGISAAKAYGTVNVLLGNLDVPGGILGCSNANWYGIGPDEYGVLLARGTMQNQARGADVVYPPTLIDMSQLFPMAHTATMLSWKAINEPQKYGFDYDIRFLLLHGNDPLCSNIISDRVIDGMKKISFVTSITPYFDLPSQFCDILLPEDSLLERTTMYRMYRNEKECNDKTRGLMGTLVRQPVVEKIYDSRQFEDIMLDLIDRVGKTSEINALLNSMPLYKQVSSDYAPALTPENHLDITKKHVWRDYLEAKLKSDFGPQASFDDFKECSFKPYKLSMKESYNYYYIPEDKARLPIYYQRMVQNGEKMMQQYKEYNVKIPNWDLEHAYSHYSGMPVWQEKDANFETTAEYPYKVIQWKIHYGTTLVGNLYNNAYMQEVIDNFNPNIKCIQVPVAIANELGLKEGDTIRVEARYAGSVEGKVHITKLLHPKVIGIPGKFGSRTKYMMPLENTGVSFNRLLTDDERYLNPVSLAMEASPQVRITKV
jgi:anaerobic selenocysteine-containing dehydrogenase